VPLAKGVPLAGGPRTSQLTLQTNSAAPRRRLQLHFHGWSRICRAMRPCATVGSWLTSMRAFPPNHVPWLKSDLPRGSSEARQWAATQSALDDHQQSGCVSVPHNLFL
jgi:hypothetical protein